MRKLIDPKVHNGSQLPYVCIDSDVLARRPLVSFDLRRGPLNGKQICPLTRILMRVFFLLKI